MRCYCSAIGRLLLAGAFVTALGVPDALAQTANTAAVTATRDTNAKAGPPPAVRAAMQFVLAAYPDLMQRPIAFSVQPVGESLAVTITDRPDPNAQMSSLAPLVSAVIAFDAGGQLTQYRATGVLLDDTRNTVLRQQLAAHPDWKESDVDLLVQGIGGQTVLSQAPPAATTLGTASVSTFLGQSVSAETSSFKWQGTATSSAPGPARTAVTSRPGFEPQQSPPGAPPPPAAAVAPVWVVETNGQDAAGHPVRYRLEYEPFGGRLVGAVRQ